MAHALNDKTNRLIKNKVLSCIIYERSIPIRLMQKQKIKNKYVVSLLIVLSP